MKKKFSSRQHMLLIHQPNGPAPSREYLDPIMERFGKWMSGLYRKGQVAATNGLAPAGKVLRGPTGEAVVTDGPYAEGKEVVGGYVLLNVATMRGAVKIAQQCPGLDYGLAVEVREVVDHGGGQKS